MPLDIKKNCLFEKILTQDTIAEHNFCLKNSDLFLFLHHVEKKINIISLFTNPKLNLITW